MELEIPKEQCQYPATLTLRDGLFYSIEAKIAFRETDDGMLFGRMKMYGICRTCWNIFGKGRARPLFMAQQFPKMVQVFSWWRLAE